MYNLKYKKNKKTDWKNFFKPNKEKIIWSIILTISLMILSMSPLAILFSVFYFATSVLSNLFFHFGLNYFYISITFLILIAYPFGCYITVKKKKIAGILFYFLTIIAITFVAYSLIDLYNNHYGKTCEIDSDCSFNCGEGSYNDKYFSLKSPFIIVDCYGQIASFCNNNQCETFDPINVKSIGECERITNVYSQEGCYYYLAKKNNDSTLCEKIVENKIHLKENCLSETK